MSYVTVLEESSPCMLEVCAGRARMLPLRLCRVVYDSPGVTFRERRKTLRSIFMTTPSDDVTLRISRLPRSAQAYMTYASVYAKRTEQCLLCWRREAAESAVSLHLRNVTVKRTSCGA
uniref:Uncharacterized protein n=1 Tax=Peronospora matthiolae TaxID=2874970 RepID=A0AAV1U503_9STRA